jgi:hypothetical protein
MRSGLLVALIGLPMLLGCGVLDGVRVICFNLAEQGLVVHFVVHAKDQFTRSAIARELRLSFSQLSHQVAVLCSPLAKGLASEITFSGLAPAMVSLKPSN